MLTVRHLTIFLAVAALVAIPAQVLAAPTQGLAANADAPSGRFLRQEVVGLEVHGLSLVQGDSVSSRPGVGIGAMLRIGRHRWSQAYFTPLQAGVFVANPTQSGPDAISARVLVEGGAIIRGGAGVLELGLGAGAGILAIKYGENRCDGSCSVGGKGVLVSPVARFLFREASHVPFGIVLRAEVPLTEPDGAGFGYFTGYGTQILLGLDVGAGW